MSIYPYHDPPPLKTGGAELFAGRRPARQGLSAEAKLPWPWVRAMMAGAGPPVVAGQRSK
ncbi:MAG: hypothetical protein O7D96_04435 [SAR324 cluster bacterium]|nr:hypothetical protein [SAR324 cluster bacterium]